MRVETVSFVTRVRLPDGKHETTISMQNQHQKLSYEVQADPKLQLVNISSIRPPSWTCLVPMSNCTFITLERAQRKVSAKPRVPTEEPPRVPVITQKRRVKAK
jgi:hypothetical protein